MELTPSTSNIPSLSWNAAPQEPQALVKEPSGLFDTISIISSRRSTDIPSSTFFRGKRIILLALGLGLSATLVLVGASLQIFVTHDFTQQGSYIITSAPLGSIVAFTLVLSVLFILTVPCLLNLLGYSLAWSWLKSSLHHGPNRPTPYQLGVVMDILHGGHLPSLWSAVGYIHSLGKDKRRPPIIKRAVTFLAIALFLSYSFFLVAIAFSLSSTPLSFVELSSYSGTWPRLSRQINSTMCATTSGAVALGINLCGLQSAASTYPFADSLPEGLRTLTNNSANNAVAFGNDGTAFLVPANIPDDVAYYGTSNGVLADCQSVTPECLVTTPSRSPLSLKCPSSVGFNASLNTATNQYSFGILDASGNPMKNPYNVSTNPFQFGAVVQSQAYASADQTYVGYTGFFTHGTSAYNVLTCSVFVRSFGYTYFNGSFTVDPSNSYVVTNLDIVRGIGAMTAAASLSDRVPAAIEGAGLNASTNAEYADAFSRELSRELIAFTSVLYESAPPHDVQQVRRVLGTRLSLPFLVTLLLWTAAYCLLVLVLAIKAISATYSSPYTLLAAQRLRSPLTAIHAAYGRSEAHRTWESSPTKLFSAEADADRLSIGPTAASGGGLAFAVTRIGAGAA
ncbi:hypothetical protein MIND_00989100 [Mycena indigotica]|uniref:Uncharacterized protein n=1 Tax=Mycena indigotica TaxID=2126181 RepID=A0A8H6VWI7_9AGAR|nr:uncharacterized protein MIND_00989100 [Mycena indigotica]KAF7294526.1 hypothetical protein MIND_00989100 [Mycena indigotica]